MKQSLLAGLIVLILIIIGAILTPWNENKSLFMFPVLIISSLIGTLIARKFFVDK